jgi:diguanylate cyclase (GGDEF)-like protein
MDRSRLNSFFFRLLGVLVCLALLAAVPLAWFAVITFQEEMTVGYTREARIGASGLANAAFDALRQRDYADLQTLAVQMVAASQLDVAIVTDPSGRILAHSDPDYVGTRMMEDAYHRVGFLAAEPVSPGGSQPLGTAWAGVSHGRMERKVNRFLGTAVLIFFASVLTGIGLAALFAYRVSRPLRRLTDGAWSIAAGNLDHAVEGRFGPTEMEELADAFERMRLALRKHVDRLERSGALLDRKVRDISLLYSISEAMNAGDYSEGMLDLILESAVDSLAADFGLLALADDPEPGRLRVVSSRGVDRNARQNPRLDAMLEQAHLAIVRQETMRVEGLCAGVAGTGGQLNLPLIVEGKAVGAMTLGRESGSFSLEDEELAAGLAAQAARCVERAQLYEASITDGLTGLHVARYFGQRLRQECRSAARYGRAVSVVMADVDFFKAVNDTYGHPAGDAVLRTVAACIRETVRDASDIAARYGGEEFAIILPETDLTGAAAVAERLRMKIEDRSVLHDDRTIRVTLSAGVASFPVHGQDPASLVRAADQALYAAKQTGRNRVIPAAQPPQLA